MTSFWRFLLDLTYPIVAYTTVRFSHIRRRMILIPIQGHEFNKAIYKVTEVVLFSWKLASLFLICRRFTTFTLRICGSRISATPPIFALPEWKYTKLAMHGDSFVGPCSSNLPIMLIKFP
jgi:hypothetical protein